MSERRAERYRGIGTLLRETDHTFALRVHYDIGVYQQIIRIASTGEEVPTTRTIRGRVSSDEQYALLPLVSFMDLVLTLEDNRRLRLFITSGKTGEIHAKGAFES